MVPTAEHYDVVIIGGGPGGYATALYGASAGLNIAMIEKGKLGGTCLNVGCIPAKELLETAASFLHVKDATDFGIVTDGEPGIDWSTSLARKDTIVTGLVSGLGSLLKSRKVTVLDGHGRLHAGKKVTVSGGSSGDVELTGDAIVLAPGSVPRTLPGFDVDGQVVMTSDEFLSIAELPKTAAIIGGGVVGCEFASLLSDLGTKVTILEALPKILPGLDKDLTKVIEKSFKKRGIDIRTDVKVEGHSPTGSGTTVQAGGEGLDVDVVVVSVGRKPNTADLGLDGTDVKVSDRGFIEVDEGCRTGEAGVWAVGDAIATPALAHIAFIEGINAVQDILGENPAPVDYGKVPWAVYTRPEAAFTGLSEEAAKEAGLDVGSKVSRFNHNGRAMIVNQPEGMVKVIAEKDANGKAGRIVGVHMVGPWVTEQLGQGYLAVNWEATVDDMAPLIQPHPTMTEALGEAIISLTGRPLHG